MYNTENASPHTLSEQPSNLTLCQNTERRWNQTSLYRTAKLQTNIGQLQSQWGIWEKYLSSLLQAHQKPHIKSFRLYDLLLQTMQIHGNAQTSCFLIIYKFPHHCREEIRQRINYIVEQKCEGLAKNCRWLKPNSTISSIPSSKTNQIAISQVRKKGEGSLTNTNK